MNTRVALRWLLACAGLTGFVSAGSSRVLEVRVAYRWAGLSPTWPAYDYVFTCADAATCTVRSQRVEQNASQPEVVSCRQERTRVDPSALQSLSNATLLNLKAVARPVQVITHTDDYPRFMLTVTTAGGVTELLNTSNSSTPPWNVQRNGRWFVQTTGEIDAAFDALMGLVPCERR